MITETAAVARLWPGQEKGQRSDLLFRKNSLVRTDLWAICWGLCTQIDYEQCYLYWMGRGPSHPSPVLRWSEGGWAWNYNLLPFFIFALLILCQCLGDDLFNQSTGEPPPFTTNRRPPPMFQFITFVDLTNWVHEWRQPTFNTQARTQSVIVTNQWA